MYGEHHALPELVAHAAVVVAHGQTGVHQVFQLVAGRHRGVGEAGPSPRSPAEAELVNGLVFYAPGAEIGVAHGAPFA